MGKSLWIKEKHEVQLEELLAFTLAKIQPFEWVRITMFVKDNLFHHPPVFCWRFANGDAKLYEQISRCVSSFVGGMEWVMYKGDGIDQSGRNYTIEPKLFNEQRLAVGNEKLPEVLKDMYLQECLKAVSDIEPLCVYIEECFNIVDVKPHLPVLPFAKTIN